jgi:hypothetical protein
MESGKQFTTADYWAPTPSWAEYGAPEEGFDPMVTPCPILSPSSVFS